MFHNTLKTRLAISYAVLFFISCLAIMALCSGLVYSLLNKAFDANAERIARRTAELHLIGRRIGSFNEILAGSDYPEEQLKQLQKSYPGVTVLFTGCRNGTQDLSLYHTAFALYRQEFYEMRILPEKKIYSKKIHPEHNKNAVKSYFSQLLLNRGKDNFSISIFDRDGSVYLESSPGAIPQQIYEKFLKTALPKNADFFRYCAFELADGRKIIVGFTLRRQLEWLADINLIAIIVLCGMTLAGALTAWLLTRRFIRGVKETTLAMNAISSGDYSIRLRESTAHDREIRELTATFNAMNERTENLLKELRTVSDDVAHDLRTPLTRISGIVELMLSQRDLPENMRNSCVSVAEEITRLKELVNAIMEISRTNAVPGTLQPEPIDLTDVTKDFCDFMQVAFEEKGLQFTVSMPTEKIIVSADKRMYQRLLSNLLGNALKFTERGFAALELSRTRDGITLIIADSGCGIPEKDQPEVFKRFFRSDASRHLQGNGLGLSLVKAIVKAHKWQIALASTPGVGTRFTITIPDQKG